MNKINKKENIDKEVKQKKTNKEKITVKKAKKKKEKTKNKIDYRDLTVAQIEKELKRETYKSKYIKILMSTVYTLIIVASVAALIATLIMPVLQISGSSMSPTLNEGEIVLSIKTKNLQTGDVIAFYHGNKILVKRVIASSGNWVNITEDGSIYINDKLLEETYIEKKHYGNDTDIEFPYQVPEGSYFVLGDDRETSIDSRNSLIGSILQEDVIGKAIFKVWPIRQFGTVN